MFFVSASHNHNQQDCHYGRHHYEEYVFFGDKCDIGGNDYSLYERATEKWKVANYEHTFRILKKNRKKKLVKKNSLKNLSINIVSF